jgi:hypothetical protein
MTSSCSCGLRGLCQTRWVLVSLALIVALIVLQCVFILDRGRSISSIGSLKRAFSVRISESVEDTACPLNRKYVADFARNYSQYREQMKERILQVKDMWREGNAKVYVQHIHKGGGSTLCDFLAHLPGLGVSHQNNCNGPREFFHITASDFKRIEDHMNSRKQRFVFNERSMASMHVSAEAAQARKHFILLTSIRHPLDRIVSHMAQVYGREFKDANDVDELLSWLRNFLKDSVDQEALLSKKRTEFHHHENNFESMVLLGRFYEQTSTTAVSTENALEALSMFDIVIPTDQLSDGLQVIQSIFAQQAQSQIKQASKNVRVASKILSDAIRTRDDLRDLHVQILSENCADLALYQRSILIFHTIMQALFKTKLPGV